MKLISMTDFVEDILEYTHESRNYIRELLLLQNYLELLKQPLKLEMFLPCYSNGEPIKKPNMNEVPEMPVDLQSEYWNEWNADYDRAKEKVLFEGFEVNDLGAVFIKLNNEVRFVVSNVKNKGLMPDWNIEYLVKHELTLTPSAIKQIGI